MEKKELGEKIKYLRGKRGMTQNALAEMIDVTFQQVQKYENGQSNITVERLYRIADAFEISVEDFFTGEPTPSLLKEEHLDGTPLTVKERELLSLFRSLKSDKLKSDLITHLRNINEIQ